MYPKSILIEFQSFPWMGGKKKSGWAGKTKGKQCTQGTRGRSAKPSRRLPVEAENTQS